MKAQQIEDAGHMCMSTGIAALASLLWPGGWLLEFPSTWDWHVAGCCNLSRILDASLVQVLLYDTPGLVDTPGQGNPLERLRSAWSTAALADQLLLIVDAERQVRPAASAQVVPITAGVRSCRVRRTTP